MFGHTSPANFRGRLLISLIARNVLVALLHNGGEHKEHQADAEEGSKEGAQLHGPQYQTLFTTGNDLLARFI